MSMPWTQQPGKSSGPTPTAIAFPKQTWTTAFRMTLDSHHRDIWLSSVRRLSSRVVPNYRPSWTSRPVNWKVHHGLGWACRAA